MTSFFFWLSMLGRLGYLVLLAWWFFTRDASLAFPALVSYVLSRDMERAYRLHRDTERERFDAEVKAEVALFRGQR